MRLGDLVVWHSPDSVDRLGLVVEELIGHGQAVTGWWRILVGDRKHLVRDTAVSLLRSA